MLKDPSVYHFLTNFQYLFLPALLFLLLGFLIGWFLWRNCREKAEEIERHNQRLRDQEQGLKQEHQRLLKEYEEARRMA
ncbi:MAG: hypothetical protein AAF514_18845 [Verrucomicrobiota bacterium]